MEKKRKYVRLPRGRSRDELEMFIRKLELQAKETAEERIPLYLRVGVKEADLILDVGCGKSSHFGIYARSDASVTGIDLRQDYISHDRETLAGRKLKKQLKLEAHRKQARREQVKKFGP